jgi:uncharacterized protein YaiI (UPF0178 family)
MDNESSLSPVIWIDADSFPREAKGYLVRLGARLGYPCVLVACIRIDLPLIEDCTTQISSNFPQYRSSLPPIGFILVPKAPDAADEIIAARALACDLVFTRDIRFACTLAHSDAPAVFNDRGVQYTSENVRERASQAIFMADLRQQGLVQSKSRSYGAREVQALSQAVDRFLHQKVKR